MTGNIDGIDYVNINNDIYVCWKVKYIRPFIVKFLKEKFPESLITYETNKIDIVLMNPDIIIPVEIQKGSYTKRKNNKHNFRHAAFEDFIRRQIEDNIENYGLCWLFIDSEYFRNLSKGTCSSTVSINMTWIINFIRKEQLKIYAIKYDGTVRELCTKDFDFLKDVSQECIIGYDNDERILNRNKLKIYRDILKGYNFTQEEIDNIYDYVGKNRTSEDDHIMKFLRKEQGRLNLFGKILYSITELKGINRFLDMRVLDIKSKGKIPASDLGIFNIVDRSADVITMFLDKFDICKYFPGYIRNKEKWDYLKESRMKLKNNQFEAIVTGKVNPLDWKKLVNSGW